MPFTILSDWNTIPVPGVTDFNTYIRDNDNYLFSGRPASPIARLNGADYTTTSTTFVDIDSTNLVITATFTSGKALVVFTGCGGTDGVNGEGQAIDITMDGVTLGAAGGVQYAVLDPGGNAIWGICIKLNGLSVGSHTFKPRWKTTAGTAHLFSGGAGNFNVPVFFSVTEIG